MQLDENKYFLNLRFSCCGWNLGIITNTRLLEYCNFERKWYFNATMRYLQPDAHDNNPNRKRVPVMRTMQ